MKSTFFTFMQHRIDQLEQLGRFRTAETHRATLQSFILFRNGKDLSLSRFNSDLMLLYEAFLKNRRVCPNTISFYMRILRAVYNQAAEKGLCSQKYPFRHVYTGVDKTVKRALALNHLKELKALSLGNEPRLAFARDLFLFSFYTRGMSFIDMAYLHKKDINNHTLSYRRRKTGQCIYIQWERCMQDIVNRYPTPPESPYLLPIIYPPYTSGLQERRCYQKALHSINHQLKILSKRMGLPAPLTTYVARHTWANIARNQDIPIPVISEGLGHHSEQTTRIYLTSLDTSIIDEANRKIIEIV